MKLPDIIGLFSYYTAILAIALSFFATQIESWRSQVLALEKEWSPADHEADHLLKVRHQAMRRGLRATVPWFALWAPLLLSVVLLGMGILSATCLADEPIAGTTTIFLLVPSLLLVAVFTEYSRRRLGTGLAGLDDLSG